MKDTHDQGMDRQEMGGLVKAGDDGCVRNGKPCGDSKRRLEIRIDLRSTRNGGCNLVQTAEGSEKKARAITF